MLTGQVALDHDGKIVNNNMGARTRQLFEIIFALLADRCATFADFVNIHTYLSDLSRLPEHAAVRLSYFGESRPTSMMVEVSRLFKPGALLEIGIAAVI
ncbi:RidA family protein [Amycolatopsis sp. FDAARGOS 1241]|uniref:RidA family protein n=1 Tax=Amycolatopsis sp. FDAARGOS 1241 TaxID=2778070 RepID=UPI00194FD4B2|nr:Rid family hydrolase [Amycolatopsis sp. FDAARGOS 1241]QRP46971.1 hypothetical protein I6J71_02700 [Amycolatopsis sp. FDAARGOS 1241]